MTCIPFMRPLLMATWLGFGLRVNASAEKLELIRGGGHAGGDDLGVTAASSA